MTDQTLTIPIDAIERDFEDFLSPDSNKRIIFSGPFGIGKTYFLDKFFKNRKEKYYSIFLRPVNYSVLTNEDIFKLLKYDLIFQMLKDINFEQEFDFSKLEYSSSFLKDNKYLILKNLLRHIPLIKQGIEIGQDMESLVDSYQKGWSQINKSKNDKILKEFYEANENHFLLEFDYVSRFISEQLNTIAEKKGESENLLKKVLIIDDLDRLDPEHIFRLFNVFSAHFDHVNYYSNGEDVEDNKFGFDKIIFVCDVENIRKIFSHKYGVGVDFSGYLDKFNSKQIFSFFHKEAYENHIYEYLRYNFRKFVDGNSDFKYLLKLLIHFLFEGKQFNIRDVERFGQHYMDTIIINDEKYRYPYIQMTKLLAQTDAFLRDHEICQLVYIFSIHFGNSAIFREKLVRAHENVMLETDEHSKYYMTELTSKLMLFADYKNHKFIPSDKETEFYTWENIPYRLACGKEQHFYRSELMWYRIDRVNKMESINQGVFFKVLCEACINIIDSGILKLQ